MRTLKQISIKEQQELLAEFCEAFLNLRNLDEAVKFLTDLLTKREILVLAKRIKIAKYLLKGKSYREIEGLLNTSHGTVAKIAEWLTEAGEGFRLIAERTKKEKPKPPSGWKLAMEEHKRFKKKFPLYFWPELLIEEIVTSANKRQKRKIHQALESLDKKSLLYKKINKILKK